MYFEQLRQGEKARFERMPGSIWNERINPGVEGLLVPSAGQIGGHWEGAGCEVTVL